jgi:hypothetical protein
MLAQSVYLAAIAASATATVVIPMPADARQVEIQVVATEPVTGVFTISHDGTNYVASNMPAISAAPGVPGSVIVSMQDSPRKVDAGPIVDVKLVLTCGATAGVVSVLTQSDFPLGY